VLRKNGSDLEHFTSAFAIRGSNDRGMDVQESSALKELMGGKSKTVSNSGDSTKCVCASS
jgi:hypothetical protein